MDSSRRFSWERPASIRSDSGSNSTNWEDEKVIQKPSPACSTDSLISHRSVSWTVDKLEDEERIDKPTASEPPADQGKAAWLFLFGSFWIEALVWGFPFSFGVFQEYYATHEPFSAEFASVPAIGTTASVSPQTILLLVLSEELMANRVLCTFYHHLTPSSCRGTRSQSGSFRQPALQFWH